MLIENKFKGIHYSSLTDEQIVSMSEEEFINKSISDEVDEVLKYHSKMVFMEKNLYGSSLLFFLSLTMIGYLGFIMLIPVLFFVFMYNKRKNNFKWCVRSLKLIVSLSVMGDNFYVKYGNNLREQLKRLGDIYIGDFYR